MRSLAEVVLAGMLVVACGGPSPPPEATGPPRDRVIGAVDRAVDAPRYSITLSQLPPLQSPQAIQGPVTMDVDLDRMAMHAQGSNGEWIYTASDGDRLLFLRGEGPREALVADTALDPLTSPADFARLQTWLQGVPPSTWIKVDARSSNPADQIPGVPLPGAQPRLLDRLFQPITEFPERVDAQLVGSEELAGVATSHFQGTLDLTESGGVSGASAGPTHPAGRLQQAASEWGPLLKFDIWIDKGGMVRRILYAHPSSAGLPLVDVTFTDFDVSDIAHPPEDQVADLPTA